ncbi:MAG: alpha-L-rhamnosidase N-terminal domain-containing protein, partial [Bacillota bacterium]|nr:alpha-L-rhamnosidase N-terminal domain-containing protein [Bacillota bacterium]
MKIIDLKTNRMTCPLGFQLGRPRLSFIVTDTGGTALTSMRVEVALDAAMLQVVYDSGESRQVDSIAWELPLDLQPCTRYYWRVSGRADNGDNATSDVTWFETAKMGQPWQARWITPQFDKDTHPVIFRDIEAPENIGQIRIYGVGLGVYELYWDGQKVGDEYLMPGLMAYDAWIQYQTYAIPHVGPGRHRVAFALGNGWYKGKFGLSKAIGVYGDRMACLAEVHLIHDDGTRTIVGTGPDWQATRSPVVSSSIYDGEERDATRDLSGVSGVTGIDLGFDRLEERLSPPLVIHERLQPVEIIRTPAGETVLDMGQNMVGWLEFTTRA